MLQQAHSGLEENKERYDHNANDGMGDLPCPATNPEFNPESSTRDGKREGKSLQRRMDLGHGDGYW